MKFSCRCGELIRISGDIPNPVEWHLVSDVGFDELDEDATVDHVYFSSTLMFRCPACDRLWIYWDGLDGDATCYASEPPT